jgi:hypothetical protein
MAVRVLAFLWFAEPASMVCYLPAAARDLCSQGGISEHILGQFPGPGLTAALADKLQAQANPDEATASDVYK